MSTERIMLRSGQSIDLVNHETEWGIAVAEARSGSGASAKLLKGASFLAVLAASIAALPIVAGYLAFPSTNGIAKEALIVISFIGLALFFQAQARKGPRNSLQIDYSAGEVRLGTQNADGTFSRHRVCSFRHIKQVSVDPTRTDNPAIKLHLSGEVVTIRFKDAEARSLDLIAAKINAARESAKKAPIRSRVQSVIMGIDASYREVGTRVKSRVVSRTA